MAGEKDQRKMNLMNLQKIAKCLDLCSNIVERGTEIVLTLIMMIMTTIVFIEVISRFFLHFSLIWSSEFARILLMWVAFTGASLALKKGQLVSIRFFVELFSPAVGELVNIGVHIIILCFLFIGFEHGGLFINFLVESGQVSASLRIPMWVHYSAFPTGFALMILHTLSITWSLVIHALSAQR